MEYGYKVTTTGRSVITACWALQKPLRLTRVTMGSGRIAEDADLADVHALLNPVVDGSVGNWTHEDNRLNFIAQYENISHPEIEDVFQLSEFIVWAEDPETGAEVDFLYATLGDYIQSVPPYRATLPTSVFKFPVTVVVSDEMEVTISAPTGLATVDDIADMVKKSDLQKAFEAHSADETAHAAAIEAKVQEMVEAGSLADEESVSSQIDAALADRANNVGSAIIRRITIPAAGWVEVGADAECVGENKYTIDIAMTEATEDHFPSVALDIGSLEIASNAEMCPTIQTLDGIVRFWAMAVPSADLTGTILLRSENLVDMDIATDDEVDDTVDDIFGETGSLPSGYEVATDEEVKEAITDIFG